MQKKIHRRINNKKYEGYPTQQQWDHLAESFALRLAKLFLDMRISGLEIRDGNMVFKVWAEPADPDTYPIYSHQYQLRSVANLGGAGICDVEYRSCEDGYKRASAYPKKSKWQPIGALKEEKLEPTRKGSI